MNRVKKKLVVRFFSIDSKDEFFQSFESVYKANKISNNSRIINIRSKKHLVKISDEHSFSKVTAYAVTVVRERNTWQTRATSDGLITGVSINQGIIGDPYYYFVIPKKKLLLGFTSGPSGSLMTVGKNMLEQFSNSRQEAIKLSLIPKEKEFATLQELSSFNSLHFKVNSSSLADISEEAPQLLKDLSQAPYINSNIQLALDFELEKSDKQKVIEIVNFLSDHDGCRTLRVRGVDVDGKPIHLDFGNAFINYKAEITTRNQFIDEISSTDILKEALSKYLEN